MKKITLSADEDCIEQARLVAKAQRMTRNAVYREWRVQYSGYKGSAGEFDSLMKVSKMSGLGVVSREESALDVS